MNTSANLKGHLSPGIFCGSLLCDLARRTRTLDDRAARARERIRNKRKTTQTCTGPFPISRAERERIAKKALAAADSAIRAGLSSFVANLRAEPKLHHASALRLMALIDWYTHHYKPLPRRVLAALAVAMGIRKKQRGQHHADRARQLRAANLTALEITHHLGLSYTNKKSAEAFVRRLCERPGAPDYGWTCAADVIAAVQADTRRSASLLVRQRLYDAVRWFADRDEPLPVAIWWAVAVRLGLGHYGDRVRVWRGLQYGSHDPKKPIGIRPKSLRKIARKAKIAGLTRKETELALQGRDVYRGRPGCLTQDTITALSGGVFRVAAREAALDALAEAKAGYRREDARKFKGVEPKTADTLAAVADKADGRGGNLDNRDDFIRKLAASPSWAWDVWSREILIRSKRSHKLRPKAISLVVAGRRKLPEGEFRGCYPYTPAELAEVMDVQVDVVEHWLSERRRVDGRLTSAWDVDCEARQRRLAPSE